MSPAPGPKRTRRVSKGASFHVTTCPGCQAWPVRDQDGDRERTAYSWLIRCDGCGQRLCRTCLPDDAEQCKACAEAAGVGA